MRVIYMQKWETMLKTHTMGSRFNLVVFRVLFIFLVLNVAFCSMTLKNCYSFKDSSKVELDLDKLVEAVWSAEGGVWSSVPYGLVDDDWCMDEPGWCRYYAREILFGLVNECERSPDVISCVGSRYAPTSGKGLTDLEKQMNVHWIINVKWFYGRQS